MKLVVIHVSQSFSLCVKCSEKFLTPVETLILALEKWFEHVENCI